MPNQPKEPNADLRTFAAMTRQMFLALIEEGFTEAQALIIVGQVVAAGISST